VDDFGGYVTGMSDILQSQLRITAWPGVALPVPDAYRVRSRLTDEGVIVPCPQGEYGLDWEEEAVALNGETYLELAGVNLDDPDAIFAFVQKYGTLDGWSAYLTIMNHGGYAVTNLYGPQLNEPLEREKKERALAEEASHPKSVWPSDVLRWVYTETLDEFRFVARCLRDMRSAWRIFRDGTAASEVEWVSPDPTELQHFGGDGFPVFLLDGLLPDYFLRSFTPHVNFRWTPPLAAGPVYANLPARQGPVNIEPTGSAGGPLYSICALELFNHMVENAEYLICGNENCQQKNFVHQQGRKKNWHRSSGVLYCSPACAHAVAQRRYRQRRRSR
jgi:hypothetical protein